MLDEREGKMKTLANDILEQCQKQGLTFQETKTLLMLMEQRVNEGRDRAMEEVGAINLAFVLFKLFQSGGNGGLAHSAIHLDR